MRWKESVVVVTGASRGVGRAIALAASRRGAVVGLLARSADELRGTLGALRGRGACAVADVGDREQLAGALAELEGQLGPTDLLVCNAGVGAYGPLVTSAEGAAERLIRTNYLGAVHAIRSVGPGMIARGRGHIVLVGSIAGRLGVPLEAEYSASKFALAGLADAISVELGVHGVGVTLVSLGPADTAFFSARGEPYRRRWPRPMRPERVAELVVRAVERRRAEVVAPRALRIPMIVHALAPALYRKGVVRALANELRVSIPPPHEARWGGGNQDQEDAG